MFLFIIFATLCVPFYVCDAALTLTGKRCGTNKVCSLIEYCSSFHNQCESCAGVCDQAAHNFDQEICTNQCQGNCFWCLSLIFF